MEEADRPGKERERETLEIGGKKKERVDSD